jgi:hypothetical protein
MQHVPSGGLQKSTFLAGVATCIAAVACIIYMLVAYQQLVLGYISYCIYPVLISVFCILADEKKMSIANHKVGSIIIYILFALWGLGAIWEIISLIRVIEFIGIVWILGACLVGANVTTGVFGFLYWHSVKTNAALNGDAPLLNTQV